MNALEKIVTIFLPPYKISDLYKIFIVLFIAVSLPLTVLETTTGQNLVSQASSQNSSGVALVTISSLDNQAVVSGQNNLTVTSTSQDFSIKTTELLVNGRTLGLINNPANGKTFTTTFVWNTLQEKNGNYILIASSLDSSGGKTSSKPLTVVVSNIDTTPPTLSFVQPTDGSYLNNQSDYLVKLDANDNSAVSQVILIIDNSVATTLTAPPYQYHWDLGSAASGTHRLTAFAFDLAGNKTVTKITLYKGVKGINADF